MKRLSSNVVVSAVMAVLAVGAATVGLASAGTADQSPVVRAALPAGTVNHVLVIDLENESFSSTFGPNSVATYLNQTLVPQGELLQNYFATGHVSLDNYIAQISGQAPTRATDSDCGALTRSGLVGQYVDVTPGTDDPNTSLYPGQVDGNGCVYPAPTATTTGAPTIADQLDALYPPNPVTHVGLLAGIRGEHGERPDAGRRGRRPARRH